MEKIPVTLFVGEKNFQQKKENKETQTGYKRHYEKPFFDLLKGDVNFEVKELYTYWFNSNPKLIYLVNQILHIFKFKKIFSKKGIKHIMFAEEAFMLRFFSKTKKVVVSCLDLIPIAFPKEHGFLFRLFYKFAIKGMRKADYIIANSEYTKLEVIKYLDIPSEKIKVAYPAVGSQFKEKHIPESFYHKYKLSHKKTYLLYVGGLDLKRKNIDKLLEAAELLKSKKIEFELLLVGYTCAKSKFKEYKGTARVFSNVSDDDLVHFYNVAKVFVFPSLYEGFGLPPVEAMACGTPVITSVNSSLPEVCGDAAFYINPEDASNIADAVIMVLNEEKAQKEMIKHGLERAKRYTEKNYADSTLEVYNLMK